VVVTDRYVDSTLAYQGAGRALADREVERVARWATADLRPHLTVLLDLPPQQGMSRFRERDRIEGESLEFHERVREGFLHLAGLAPEHYLVVDARRPVEEIAAAIRARVLPLLGQAARPHHDPSTAPFADADTQPTRATQATPSTPAPGPGRDA
jgi:dTMP kinase